VAEDKDDIKSYAELLIADEREKRGRQHTCLLIVWGVLGAIALGLYYLIRYLVS
jgi:hypothetical protein